MKKGLIMVSLGVLVVSLMMGCSKGFVSQKTTDGITITLKADRYPLIKGDNALSVVVADASGKAVDNTSVMVRYFMPPMPGMAPMEYNAPVQAKGGGYGFTANIPMEGGWRVEVAAIQTGKPAVTATFNVDAR